MVAVGRALAVAVSRATVLLLVVVDAPPLEALRLLWDGSFGTLAKFSDTLMTWIPLVLAAAGLIVTFQAGLWNIGVEGQIVAGAIGATWIARELGGPAALVIAATIVAGAAAGAAYALVPGFLRSRFEVHEIFSGVALNFLAGPFAVYLIIGPWSRSGIASTSGTDIIAERAWLPTLGLAAHLPRGPRRRRRRRRGVVAVLIGGTRYGLRLKAVGRSPASARLMGVSPRRYTLSAFAIGGALAGVAGSRAGDRVPPQARAVDLRRLRVPRHPRRAAGQLPGRAGSPRSPCSSPPSRSAARSCRCGCRSTRRSPA